MRVLELLSNIIEKTGRGGQLGLKEKSGLTLFNLFYALAHIAVQSATNAMNLLSLSPESRTPGVTCYDTQQALANNVNISATCFFSFLPILGLFTLTLLLALSLLLISI